MKWTYETIQRQLDELFGQGSLDEAKERKRKRIVDAALVLFAENGYRKTSMSAVAKAAGVAKGTVYLYFKDKAQLLMRVIGVEESRVLENMRDILRPELNPKERLRQWIKTSLVLYGEMPLLSRLMSGDREFLRVFEELEVEQREGLEAAMLQILGDFIDEACSPHHFTPLEINDRAKVLAGLVYFAGMLGDEGIRSGLSLERYAELMADMIVHGINKQTAPLERPKIKEEDDER